MHLPDAAAVLAHQMQNLRPGGVFVAVDYDMGGARALPEVELYSRVREWLRAGFEHADVDPFVGMRLLAIFNEAGYDEVGSLGLPATGRLACGVAVRSCPLLTACLEWSAAPARPTRQLRDCSGSPSAGG